MAVDVCWAKHRAAQQTLAGFEFILNRVGIDNHLLGRGPNLPIIQVVRLLVLALPQVRVLLDYYFYS